VVAHNLYGESAVSDSGNGAIILTVPDPPIDFQVDFTLKTRTSISLMWNEGYNGGAPILDYTLSWT
jgi:hypothetical protein